MIYVLTTQQRLRIFGLLASGQLRVSPLARASPIATRTVCRTCPGSPLPNRPDSYSCVPLLASLSSPVNDRSRPETHEGAQMQKSRSGGCQCGAVRFRAAALGDNPHVCHCRMCQKAAGNLFGARIGVLLTDLRWTRGAPSRFYSSEGVARGFCKDCGTPLFFHNETSERISMSIGAFDQPADIALEFELGIEGKLPQVAQLAGLPNFGTSEEDDPEGTARARQTSRQHPDRDTEDWPEPL